MSYEDIWTHVSIAVFTVTIFAVTGYMAYLLVRIMESIETFIKKRRKPTRRESE